MIFDFRKIQGPERSRAGNYIRLCVELIVARLNKTAAGIERIEIHRNGTIHAKTTAELIIFNPQYSPGVLKRTSLQYLSKRVSTEVSSHSPAVWVLIVPVNTDRRISEWLSRMQARYGPAVRIECWDLAELIKTLLESPQVAAAFFEPSDVGTFLRGMRSDEAALRSMNLARASTRGPSVPVTALTRHVEHSLAIGPSVRDAAHATAIHEVARLLANRPKLSVLVWGPGSRQTDPRLFKKRLEIRDELRRLGHQADFSEEILTPDVVSSGGLNPSIEELLQAVGYECIICLMATPGSIGEVHDFAHIPRIAVKMTVCVDEAHRKGYSARGALRILEGHNGKVLWYKSPTDLRNCSLASRVLDLVEKFSEAKQDHIVRTIAGGS
jgi:hypothetical protein